MEKMQSIISSIKIDKKCLSPPTQSDDIINDDTMIDAPPYSFVVMWSG